MPGQIEVIMLVDNAAKVPELATEHGLSMWVTIDGRHILFDSGMGMALPGNAAGLGVDLGRPDAIVLSHGHFDHTGGLPLYRRGPCVCSGRALSNGVCWRRRGKPVHMAA